MKISKQTIIAAALLLVGIVNELLSAFGKSPLPFENETVTELVSLIFLGISSLLALKTGKGLTPSAKLSKRLSEALKKGYVSKEKAEEFFAEIEDGEVSGTDEEKTEDGKKDETEEVTEDVDR